MEQKWILVDIGCLECGEKSKFVGFFDSKEQADKFWREEYRQGTGWGPEEWGGQHAPLIEKVELPNYAVKSS